MSCSCVEENAWLISEERIGRLVEDHRKETGSWIVVTTNVCTSYFEAVYSPVTLLGVQSFQVVHKVACEYLTYNITVRKLNV